MLDSPWVIAATAVLAGAVAAVSGFGIGSLLTPLLVVSMPTPHAVAVVAIPHVIATLIRWLRLRAHVHGPTFRQFGLASAAGGLLGAALQSRLGAPVLTIVLAALLVLAGSSELTGRRMPLPATPVWRLIGGVLSGFFGGLVGNQGGIRSAALLGFRLEPRQIVATATASALLVDAARLPVYLVTQGEAIRSHPSLVLAATVGAVLGTLVGVPLLGRIPEARYRSMVGVLLVALGLVLLSTAARLTPSIRPQ